jgi:hypothetical protein
MSILPENPETGNQTPVRAVPVPAAGIAIGRSFLTPYGLRIPQDITVAEWAELGQTLGGVYRACRFGIGDWLLAAGNLPEEHSQFLDITGLGKNSLNACERVARAFPPSRRRDISWSHHEALASRRNPIPDADRDYLLAQAETGEWTREELRERIRSVMGVPPLALPGQAQHQCPSCGFKW